MSPTTTSSQGDAEAPPQTAMKGGEDDDGAFTISSNSSSAAKSLTFRQRRLSLSNLQKATVDAEEAGQGVSAPDDNHFAPTGNPSVEALVSLRNHSHCASEPNHPGADGSNDRAQTFRKRRLSLTHRLTGGEDSASSFTEESPKLVTTESDNVATINGGENHHRDDANSAEGDGNLLHVMNRRLSEASAESLGSNDSSTYSQNHPSSPRPHRWQHSPRHRLSSRRDSECSLNSHSTLASSSVARLPCTIMHAAELLGEPHPASSSPSNHGGAIVGEGGGGFSEATTPPSPALHSDSVLYRNTTAASRKRGGAATCGGSGFAEPDHGTSTSESSVAESPALPSWVLSPPAMAEWPYSPESGGTTENRAQKGSETPAAISASHLLVQPRWKRRHVITQQDKLPFPKQVVGIYSCHGMEPVYDDDCEDEEDGETDDGGGHSNRELPGDVDDHDESRHSWNFPPPPPISSTVTAVTEGGAAQLQFTPVKPSSSTALASRSTEPEPSSSPTSTSQVRSSTVAKINQDRGGVAFPYGNCRHQALFSVYDGHGQGGELVSQFALSEIQRRLYRHPKFPESVSFVETFLKVDEALKREPLIDPTFAGTTACVVLVKRDKLVVANVGDSRAVVARKIRLSSGLSSGGNEDQSEYAAIPLTEDQNPDVPAEFERITRAGGYVTASPGPGLSARVWLDPSCTQIGLAMSRSIGDHCVSSVGVIAEPVVTHYDLDSSDEFLILASDGVWEFLDSQDAVNVVARSLEERSDDATKACQALIEAAADRWHEEEGEYRDDITAIVVRLQHLWTAEEKATESEGPSSSLSDSPPRKRPRVQDDGKDTSQHVRANEPQQG